MITVYRYENIHDGGGPFCFSDGRLRHHPEVLLTDNTMCACRSILALQEYFEKSAPEVLTDPEYEIREYTIDESRIVRETQREIIFRK